MANAHSHLFGHRSVNALPYDLRDAVSHDLSEFALLYLQSGNPLRQAQTFFIRQAELVPCAPMPDRHSGKSSEGRVGEAIDARRVMCRHKSAHASSNVSTPHPIAGVGVSQDRTHQSLECEPG